MLPPGPSQPDARLNTLRGVESAPVSIAGTLPAWREPAPSPNGNGTPAPGLSPAANIFALLYALRRRLTLALSLGIVLALIVGFGVWWGMPMGYTARTLLNVAANQPRLIFATLEDRAEFANYQRSQAAMLRSRLVLNSALRDPKVAELPSVREKLDPVQWLEGEVRVDFNTAPEILRISMAGKEADELVAIVNAVRDAYLKEIVYKERTDRIKRLDSLKTYRLTYEEFLTKRRNNLRDLAESVGSKDAKVLTLKQQYMLSQHAQIQQALLTLDAGIRHAVIEHQVEQDKFKAIVEPVLTDTLLDSALKTDAIGDGYVKEIAKLQKDIDDFKQNAKQPQSHKAFNDMAAKLEKAKQLLAARREELRGDVQKRLSAEARDKVQSNLAIQADKIHLWEVLQKELSVESARRQKELKDLNSQSIDVEWLQEEITQKEGIVKRLADQINFMEVEMESPARVTLLEDAVVYQSQDEKRPLKIGLMAAASVFGLVLFGVSWWELRSHKVNNVDEVVQGLRMPVVGALPLISKRGRRSLNGHADARDQHQHNFLIESVDATRTMLLHAARLESIKVVMVSSAMGGEGKTMLSSHLAASLARSGCKTLLIDGDLRRPSVHRLLNLQLRPGLSEILRNECTVADATRPGPVEGLHVIPAGQCDSITLQALAQEAFGAVVQQVRDEYDFVIVDSAPILPVADSLQLAQHVDGVIFSILREVSRLPSVQAAQERLAMLNVRMLGAVVNGVQTSHYSYGYGYRYAMPPVVKAGG